jgi:hypothetical protein
VLRRLESLSMGNGVGTREAHSMQAIRLARISVLFVDNGLRAVSTDKSASCLPSQSLPIYAFVKTQCVQAGVRARSSVAFQ